MNPFCGNNYLNITERCYPVFNQFTFKTKTKTMSFTNICACLWLSTEMYTVDTGCIDIVQKIVHSLENMCKMNS